MDAKKLIPKDKFDDSTISKLIELDDESFKEISDDILEWMADMNWPIASDMVDIVILKQDIMVDSIVEVFKGQDDIWKYWIIVKILPSIRKENLISILPYLNDIKENPTKNEIAEEVYSETITLLNNLD